MSRLSRVIIFAALGQTACATTTIGPTWRAPAFAGPLHKVLVCALSHDAVLLGRLEDAFVHELSTHGVAATPCYSVLPAGETTGQQVRDVLTAGGMDGLIETRVTNVSTIPIYDGTAGDFWGPYYGTWGNDWGSIYAGTYVGTSTVVSLQTKVYAEKMGGRLVWVGNSQTFDPTSLGSLVSQVASRFIKAMVGAAVIPPPQPE